MADGTPEQLFESGGQRKTLPKRIYMQEKREDRIYLSMIKKGDRKEDRMRVILSEGYIPDEINFQRPLSKEERDRANWNFFDANDNPHTYMTWKVHGKALQQVMSWPHFKYRSPEQNQNHINEMLEIQRIVLQPGFKEKLLHLENDPDGHLEDRGTALDLTVTNVPGHQPGGIHLSKGMQSGDLKIKKATKLILKLSKEQMYEAFPEMASEDHKIRWAVQAPVTPREDQIWVTSLQGNFSDLSQSLKDAIKCKADMQFDDGDDSLNLSVMLFLGHYPPGYFPGRLNIYSTRISVPLDTYGSAFVCARHPHSSTGIGPLAPDFEPIIHIKPASNVVHPDELKNLPYGRFLSIAYCRQECFNPDEQWLCKEFFMPHLEDVLINLFGSKRWYYTWIALTWIKNHIEVLNRDRNERDWQDKFCWYEDGEKQFVEDGIIATAIKYGGHLGKLTRHPDNVADEKIPEKWNELHPLRRMERLRIASVNTACGNKMPEPEGEKIIKAPKYSKPKSASKRKNGEATLSQRVKYLNMKEQIVMVLCSTMRPQSGGKPNVRCKQTFRARVDGRTICGRCFNNVGIGA